MRIGVDGLSLHVHQALGGPPCDGTAYVFSNHRHARWKLGMEPWSKARIGIAPGVVLERWETSRQNHGATQYACRRLTRFRQRIMYVIEGLNLLRENMGLPPYISYLIIVFVLPNLRRRLARNRVGGLHEN
jgi:hypothetical protein